MDKTLKILSVEFPELTEEDWRRWREWVDEQIVIHLERNRPTKDRAKLEKEKPAEA